MAVLGHHTNQNTIHTEYVHSVYEYHEIYIRSKYSTRVHNERLGDWNKTNLLF